MDRDIIAQSFKGFGGKLLVNALDFLETGDVGLGLFKPTDHGLNPGIDRVDVPGGDTHGGSRGSSPPI